jgi:hypothetical protein
LNSVLMLRHIGFLLDPAGPRSNICIAAHFGIE